VFKKVLNPKTVRFYVRFKPDEKMMLADQAKKAGLTMSEYVRRRALGIPVKGRDMEKAINELRRLGGLQKLLASQTPCDSPHYQDLLKEIVGAIKKLDREGSNLDREGE
jgi:hypothetical protein